jgi:hypothetical protein
LPNNNTATLQKFLTDNFYPANTDVYSVNPPDFKEKPAFLNNIYSE